MAEYDLFLSYNSKDADPVNKIRRRLETKGLKIWFDNTDIKGGEEWLRKMREGLDGSANFCVCIGKNGYGKWQRDEIEDALKRQNEGIRFRVIPLRLPDLDLPSGELPADDLSRRLKFKHFLSFRNSVDEPRVIDEIVELTKGPPRFQRDAPGEDSPARRPYRGLKPFLEEHAAFFMGRELITASVFVELKELADTDRRFLALLGASGSGKSSLAKAGLIPRIRDGRAPGSEHWPIVTCRCADNPLEKIAKELLAHPKLESAIVGTGSPVGALNDIVDRMRTDRETLRQTLELALAKEQFRDDCRVVLLVDQFEEFLEVNRRKGATDPPDESSDSAGESSDAPDESSDSADERLASLIRDYDAAIANLLTASQGVNGQTIVVVTLRDDFYSDCVNFQGKMTGEAELENAIRSHHRSIRRMNEEEVRQAIELPALDANCTFEPQLVNRILHDFRDQPAGALPLLEHALDQLWQGRNTDISPAVLTHDEYEKMGGLRGALNRHANDVVDHLTSKRLRECEDLVRKDDTQEHRQAVSLAKEDLQKKCRGVFLRLVRPGDTIQDATKRQARLSELSEDPAVHDIVDQLSDNRLVTTSREPNADNREEPYVEISHEALIRGWERLKDWITQYGVALRTYNQLIEAEKAWKGFRSSKKKSELKPEDFLLKGALLAQAEELQLRAEVHGIELGENEREFLDASIEARDREQRERELLLKEKAVAAEQLAEKQRQLAEEAKRLAEQERMTAATEKERAEEAARHADTQHKLAIEAQHSEREQRLRVKQFKIGGAIVTAFFAIAFAASIFWYLAERTATDRFNDAKEAVKIASTIGDSAEKYRSNNDALKDYALLRGILVDLDKAEPNDSDVLSALGNVYSAIGSILFEEKEYQLAIAEYQKALEARGKIAAERGEYKRKFANAYMNQAQAEAELGRRMRQSPSNPEEPKQAQAHFDRAREGFDKAQCIREEIRTAIRDGAPIDPDWKGQPLDGMSKLIRDLAAGYYNWGKLDYSQGKYKPALANFEKALPDAAHVREAMRDPEHEQLLGNVLTRLGETKKRLKKFDEANSHYKQAERILSPLATNNPDVDEYQRDLALLFQAWASLRYEQGDYVQAAEYRQKQIKLLETLTARRSTDPQFHDDLGIALIGLVYVRYGAANGPIEGSEFNATLRDANDYLRSIDDGRFKKGLVRKLHHALCKFYAQVARLPGTSEHTVKKLRELQAEYLRELAEQHSDDPFYHQVLPRLQDIKIAVDNSETP